MINGRCIIEKLSKT